MRAVANDSLDEAISEPQETGRPANPPIHQTINPSIHLGICGVTRKKKKGYEREACFVFCFVLVRFALPRASSLHLSLADSAFFFLALLQCRDSIDFLLSQHILAVASIESF